jgi:hypothetical protein
MDPEADYTPDPRLVATRVTTGGWVLSLSPARMEDGRELGWYPPQPVALGLIEAKRYRDRGVKEREAIMSELKPRDDGRWGWQPAKAPQVIDCVSDLQVAVLYAFTAVESLANHSIDQLDDAATIEVTSAKGEVAQLPKAEMVRRLSISEKLSRVVPMLDDGVNIKGTRPWERYRHLKGLRDELVHVKERGYSPDPEELTAYDRLMLGQGDGCVEDAIAVVVGARPTFLPDLVLEALAL